jgi:hypothetical protein
MDAIYRRAEFTIIAAAGEDENFGLPGVGTTPRSTQPLAYVGDVRIISSMAHPHHTIVSSKWATRGWTYQEAVLSRRRLVFTEDQTYFECNGMNCNESVQANFDVVHARNKYKALHFMHSGIFTGTDCFRPQDAKDLDNVANVQSYFEHVRLYSKRDLSFQTDSFKAFAGIASHFERSKYSVPHIWGLPIVAPPSTTLRLDYLESLLLWKHKHDCWSSLRKPRRRSAFPSWSWVGWSGEVDFVATPKILRQLISLRPRMSSHPFFDFDRNSSVLNIQVTIVPPDQITICNPSIPSIWNIAGCKATLSLSQAPESSENISQMFRRGKWQLVRLSYARDPHWDRDAPIFLVIERHEDCASRLGLMTAEARAAEMKSFQYSDSVIRLV